MPNVRGACAFASDLRAASCLRNAMRSSRGVFKGMATDRWRAIASRYGCPDDAPLRSCAVGRLSINLSSERSACRTMKAHGALALRNIEHEREGEGRDADTGAKSLCGDEGRID